MEGDLQRTLGRNLRAHRQKLGLSQEQFAEKLGYHRTYVGGIEQGLRNLSLRSVERLAADLGVSPNSLLSQLGSESLPLDVGGNHPSSTSVERG